MSRVQLALNVSNLETAVSFYTKLFDTPPTKVRPGYANFAIADPPLKLVLVEAAGAAGSLNHLGVEVESSDLVGEAHARLAGEGLETESETGVACCFAVQDKVWVESPDGTPWEVYTVLGEAEAPAQHFGEGTCSAAACCQG